jgi:hypothetical protein
VTVTPQPSQTQNQTGAASHPSAESQPDESFIGEVADGKTFERDIAHGLVFRLAAAPRHEVSGWNIEIVPKSGAPEDEFSWVATPPYHFENARYLDTSYAVKAKDAVAFSPRTFSFVLTTADYKVADEFVESIIYSNTASKEDLKEMDRKAAKVEVGTGELYILDSRITLGKSENETGKIEWIKFEVKLKFHSGMNMTDVLDPAMRVSQ